MWTRASPAGRQRRATAAAESRDRQGLGEDGKDARAGPAERIWCCSQDRSGGREPAGGRAAGGKALGGGEA